MARRLATFVLGLAVALSCLAACGGAKPSAPSVPPAQETASDKDAGAATAAATNTNTNTTDAGDVTPAAASATPPSPPEPNDECTPIAVDFEKRARPKLKDCYRDGKKKDPNLEGTVKITVDVDTLGKIKSQKVVEKTLPDAVATCMLKVVKATPFPEASKCPGKSLTIPMTFPTPP